MVTHNVLFLINYLGSKDHDDKLAKPTCVFLTKILFVNYVVFMLLLFQSIRFGPFTIKKLLMFN